MKMLKTMLMTLALSTSSFIASADIIVLDFENITDYPSPNSTLVNDFYNGGVSSNGSSGTDYGIGFSDNALALCLNTLGVTCSNASRGGLGNPNSQFGALFFLSGSETFMNVADGFDTGFSFFYTAINNLGSVSVFDDLNGTGNMLATVDLSLTSSTCSSEYSAQFCPFEALGVGFAGIAKSVSFAGVQDQIAFDDITFGSVTPGDSNPPSVSVPEPSTLAIFALGLIGMASRKFKK